MLGIIKGLVLLVIGLALFLTGVNSGFMDMGRIIGMQLAVNTTTIGGLCADCLW